MSAPVVERAPVIRRAVIKARGVGGRLPSSDLLSSAWALGMVSALVAALLGGALACMPMLLTWMTTPDSGLTAVSAIRLGGVLWLVSQGTPIAIAGVTYSLVPWGLGLVALALLVSGGRWAVRRSEAAASLERIEIVVAGTVAYAIAAGLTALLAPGGALVSVGPAAWHAGIVALIGMSIGVNVTASLPQWLREIGRAGLVGAFGILGVGAFVGGVSLAVNVDTAISMFEALKVGLLGGLGLTLLAVAYVPTAVVWSAAYVMGAGVRVGSDVAVSPFLAAGSPATLPPFPLLAGLPESTTPIAWTLPALVVLVGLLVGLVISRGARKETRLTRLAFAFGAAACSAVILMALSLLSSGAVGALRLAQVGPPTVAVGVLAALLLSIGAAPIAIIGSHRSGRRLAVASESVGPVHEG